MMMNKDEYIVTAGRSGTCGPRRQFSPINLQSQRLIACTRLIMLGPSSAGDSDGGRGMSEAEAAIGHSRFGRGDATAKSALVKRRRTAKRAERRGRRINHERVDHDRPTNPLNAWRRRGRRTWLRRQTARYTAERMDYRAIVRHAYYKYAHARTL